ncbi:bifunctional glutamate N-acetyltransferase/amino-acid acetyltransferase ArgJ [Desulfogranum marinum]|uniref:bifunctional glutamate N-acetyltransferase/amino-acid acetyltransferase ArgJ n=1 Tax=Desulfogranum marinum TaxID=453220 RepID=UPI001965D497|nr:bifunctional glutamate N-acetyltransferase/amino-acid acetyltransferase ArgJ [Desulfogranum marinum]MBM9513129.1 bifunctional glutamate N-acetyltransferase/amino-acid acetyltransferase ArgJ [Desulfogranum marinum]
MQVKGFSAAAVKAGIRYQDRFDLGLIYSHTPAVTAGVFTTNSVKAAPVLIDMDRLRQGSVQAVLVNSGNANACTGEAGMETALAISSLVAEQLAIKEELIQLASTGVIGEPIPFAPFEKNIQELVDTLSPDGFDDLAQAMMTTDTYPKTAFTTVDLDGKTVSILGVAKGSGMIMPDMATMLCFVVTDAQIVFPVLNSMVREGVDKSFNRITVDGDTSTNDMVLVMANGAAGNSWIDEESPATAQLFETALHGVLHDLALQIVKDGEGATKVVTIRIEGAREQEEAMSAAQTIANSALVKTAFFGEDANWGRIIAALGRSDSVFDQNKVSIAFDEVLLVENGLALGAEAEKSASEVLKNKEFTVTVDLHEGLESTEVYTCDFSYDYVKINADYRS